MRTLNNPLRYIALLLLMPSLLLAQEDKRTWYDVEVIVFEQQEARGRDAERWDSVAHLPAAEQVAPLLPASDERIPFSQLPSSALRLQTVYQQLERAAQYKPLLHIGWRQQGLSRQEAPAVPIPRDWDRGHGNADSEHEHAVLEETHIPPLFGYVRLYRERFLHVAVDLRYQRTTENVEQQYPYLEGREPVFVMRQQRRMRSGELHYLDHPVLGVLVLVTPSDE